MFVCVFGCLFGLSLVGRGVVLSVVCPHGCFSVCFGLLWFVLFRFLPFRSVPFRSVPSHPVPSRPVPSRSVPFGFVFAVLCVYVFVLLVTTIG